MYRPSFGTATSKQQWCCDEMRANEANQNRPRLTIKRPRSERKQHNKANSNMHRTFATAQGGNSRPLQPGRNPKAKSDNAAENAHPSKRRLEDHFCRKLSFAVGANENTQVAHISSFKQKPD